MKRILCFGDSNTWGYIPNTKDETRRFDENTRWPCRMARQLGEGFEVVEEGLNGRTTVFDDVTMPGRCGLSYISPCLLSHIPIDLVIFALGSNDLKCEFNLPARVIGQGMARLLSVAKQSLQSEGVPVPKLLLCSPPHIGDAVMSSCIAGIFDEESVRRSKALAGEYQKLAIAAGCDFFDIAEAARPSSVDCLHMDAEGHAALAARITEKVKNILADA